MNGHRIKELLKYWSRFNLKDSRHISKSVEEFSLVFYLGLV